MKVVAIIPALNEEQTIGAIVRTLRASKLVDRVVVVSDGSDDATAQVAKNEGAEVIQRKQAYGKGSAMRYAAARAQEEIILFLDGDLLGLSENHVRKILTPVLEGRRAMYIGFKDRGWRNWLAKQWPISGQRAIRRDLYLQLPQRLAESYSVEVALNYLCRTRGERFGSAPLPGLNFRRKIQKVGFFLGIWQYLRMWAIVLYGAIRIRLAHLLGKF